MQNQGLTNLTYNGASELDKGIAIFLEKKILADILNESDVKKNYDINWIGTRQNELNAHQCNGRSRLSKKIATKF